MSDYDFGKLNDKEFEILASDLLSAREEVRFERFKPGRDLGVDGRFFAPDGKEVILQAKHWPTSPLERLVKYLKNVELPKIQRLQPSRYLLAVSHALSRTDKNKILAALEPFVISPSDIIGREDLNDILAAHPEVERRHYKLWIASSGVLVNLINKPIFDRSSFALDEILDSLHLYVPTQSHDIAINRLESLGAVIITGPAGIGKTTLADHLCLHYVNKDFALVKIADEIREAEAVYDSDKRQTFYFDDFLGRNYLEALSGHEGSHIVQFIKRITRNKNKRFILTSRTTILNQGKLLNDVFTNNNLERNEFEVTLDSFTEMDKARVLYNHLWHSELALDFIDALYEKRRYKDIIRHRNYNPRLIRYVTDSNRLADCRASEYWAHVDGLLANPTTVWQNPFESQIDDSGRIVVLIVALNGRPVPQTDLAEAYSRYTSSGNHANYHGNKDFILTLRHLTGSLLSRVMRSASHPYVDLFNPSVGDYVLYRYCVDVPALRAGFVSLRSTSSLETLADLERNKLLIPSEAKAIGYQILRHAVEVEFVSYSPEYISLVCLQIYEHLEVMPSEDRMLALAIDFVLRSDCPGCFGDVSTFLCRVFEAGLIPDSQAANFILDACEQNPNSEELKGLTRIISFLPKSHQALVAPTLKTAVINYLTDWCTDEFEGDEVFKSSDSCDITNAYSNLRELVAGSLKAYQVEASREEIDLVVDAYDIETQATHYFSQNENEEDEQGASASSFHLDEIDDLFDRSM